MSKVLITGGDGQLSSAIKHSKMPENHHCCFVNKQAFDITNFEACDEYLDNNKIDYIINCAAYTAVDQAETDKSLALQVNADGPLNLAQLCKKYQIKLIHISTDYIYSGDSTTPYKESDPTVPVNYYGETKLQGECNIINNCRDYIIIRTGWLYSSAGKNFFNTIKRLASDKKNLSIVADQLGTPTYCGDLADFILHVINQDCLTAQNNYFQNIYNFSNLGCATWYEFAVELLRCSSSAASKDCCLNPITTEEYPLPARRPQYSILDKTKAIDTFNYAIPDWHEGLIKCCKEIC